MKIGNSTSTRDISDIRPNEPQVISQGHRGGRRTTGGMKESFLSEARSTSKAHVKAFRSGSQDARDGAVKAGNAPTGPVSRHPNVKRRGTGSSVRTPSPSGGM